ncbi:hypothetical protein [Neogemmobacter tilapiae]|uniref:Uncharacterized protein n=1 Tax=Neogemmobacter tilapiae TaxID=875041 RepID=A0A918TMB9_9RHOB|nr:hypothetical protein [Gemmobacter tilapiae]GHC53960.1 hypothetical protein GCM10007315_15940 [Gemmobacter tilapiae]
MTDPNMVDFYSRVARIQRDHARSFGAEAVASGQGTSVKSRIPVLAPVLLALICGFAMKAMLLARIGDETYAARIDDLRSGEGFERIGATLMAADPITVALAGQFEKLGF